VSMDELLAPVTSLARKICSVCKCSQPHFRSTRYTHITGDEFALEMFRTDENKDTGLIIEAWSRSGPRT
jgi:hypothetical protein